MVRKNAQSAARSLTLSFCVVFTLVGCDSRRDSHVEERVLPSGDKLINDTYVSAGFLDSSRVNRYYVVFRGTKRKEFIAQNNTTDGLLEGNDNVQLIRDGERVVVVIGHCVFKRWPRQGKPWWYEWAGRDVDALMFLRSFSTKPPPADAKSGNQWHQYERPNKFPYRVMTVDLKQNTMILYATEVVAPWPTNLVFTAKDYEFPWYFSFERTKEHNPPLAYAPFPTNLTAEITVVTAPQTLTSIPHGTGESLESVLKLPGATVAQKHTVNLGDCTKKVIETIVKLPDGGSWTNSFELFGAWGDPNPEMLSVYWRPLPLIWAGWQFMRIGLPQRVSASGRPGTSRHIFLRIVRADEAVGQSQTPLQSLTE